MNMIQKRSWALVLIAALLLSLAGCGTKDVATDPTQTTTQQVPTATETQVGATEEDAVTEETVTEETGPAALKGSLFLKVSSITFSVVGESEDIYLGVIPRELVTWESEDPDIVSVEGGVLTAVGIGTTVIHASYEDRQVSCTAGCLAQTREELEAMDPKILSQPKWLPPEVDMDAPCTYFDNAAIVGDSITYGMMQHESQSNGLGNILFMARGGVSIRGFVVRNKNIIFRGRETDLEVAIAQSGVERVFFLMGSNDVGAQYTMEAMMDDWRVILDRIWSESPDVEIVLITSIPRYEEYPYRQSPDSYNPRTVEYNEHLRQFAKENGCMFLDLHSYVQDHWGRLSPTYKIDDTHLNEVACTYWMQVMRYYAQYESEGGILE